MLGTWAGLRPLVRTASSERTADLSRRHAVTRSPSGLISVTGGKLTTYRRMAADTVDDVMAALGRSGRCRTGRLRLRGAEGWDGVEVLKAVAAIAAVGAVSISLALAALRGRVRRG